MNYKKETFPKLDECIELQKNLFDCVQKTKSYIKCEEYEQPVYDCYIESKSKIQTFDKTKEFIKLKEIGKKITKDYENQNEMEKEVFKYCYTDSQFAGLCTMNFYSDLKASFCRDKIVDFFKCSRSLQGKDSVSYVNCINKNKIPKNMMEVSDVVTECNKFLN
jgi:hypothetical protein